MVSGHCFPAPDFSVLDSGILRKLHTSAKQPKPTPIAAAKPAIPRKIIALAAAASGFRWPVEGEVIAEFARQHAAFTMTVLTSRRKLRYRHCRAPRGAAAFVGGNIKSWQIDLLHDGGIITAYAHLDAIAVKEGDIVAAGQLWRGWDDRALIYRSFILKYEIGSH